MFSLCANNGTNGNITISIFSSCLTWDKLSGLLDSRGFFFLFN